MSDKKNPTAVQIGQRIKQARKMAGFETAAQLLEEIPEWGTGRLGNYEAGISLPSPDDIKLISRVTGSSPCWIMFGLGPIRASGRDLQAIRHQNLVYVFEGCRGERGAITSFLKAVGLSRSKIDEHLDNPFLAIPDRLARKCEIFAERKSGWLDEQHVESDPVCAAFPDEMRRVMEIYSNLSGEKRELFLKMAEVFVE
ncbi:MAG: helix-turn-helix domain-containing protein [Gammaproteobacteria bacterium]|nr:helix-turn-helix domain-containing protein [Gammaproteobacteria bacterium]MDH5652001.1 helix-turn-helix domain-containing protein [Gammaproteobacteria bacterium]